MNNREKLIRMTEGSSGKVRVISISFDPDTDPTEDIWVDEEEVSKLEEEGQEYLLMFGTRPEYREEVLKKNPCLVRQPDGSYKAHNVGKKGFVYIVD